MWALLAGAPISSAPAAQCPGGEPPPCPGPPANSIAVLAFENRSRDLSDQFVAEGFTEEIIDRLRLIEPLRVTTRRYPRLPANLAEAGRALSVAWVVAGSFERAGNRLRVRITVTPTAPGAQPWSQRFIRDDNDLFAIQAEISSIVAERIVGQLLASQRSALARRSTRSNAAYLHIVSGVGNLARRTRSSLTQAVADYQRAIAADSTSARAWAGLSYAAMLLFDREGNPDGSAAPESHIALSAAAAARALELDTRSSEAWVARGYVLQYLEPKTWAGVEAALRRATELNPANSEAWHRLGTALAALVRREEGWSAAQRALGIDPNRVVTLLDFGGGFADTAMLNRAIVLAPDYQITWRSRAVIRLRNGDSAGARRDVYSYLDLVDLTNRIEAHASAAVLLMRLGDSAQARALGDRALEQLTQGHVGRRVGLWLARHLLSLGREREAVDVWLRIRPRGIDVWNMIHELPTDLFDRFPELRRLREEVRPAWLPPPEAR